MSAKKSNESASLKLEATKWLKNADDEYHRNKTHNREDLLAYQLTHRLVNERLNPVSTASSCLLMLGQGAYVIEGNLERALTYFAEIRVWLPFFDASVGASVEERIDAQGNQISFGAYRILEMIICALLCGDRELALYLSRGNDAAFLDPNVFDDSLRNSCLLVSDMRRLIRGESNTDIGLRDQKLLKFKSMVVGYERLLYTIAERDVNAFEKAMVEIEAAFRDRAKSRRESGLNEYGYGKLAQAATFDVLGTSLCRLAAWTGMEISVDSPLYPREFWVG